MGLLIRSLLIWLLVLAVPAQGAAVVTMVGCGPKHHGVGAARALLAPAVMPHAHTALQVAGAHDHPALAAPQAGHADGAGHAGDSGDATASTGQAPHTASAGSADLHKCSVCASCCSAGAILSTVSSVPARVISREVFADVLVCVDAFAADGPDRPPRAVVA